MAAGAAGGDDAELGHGRGSEKEGLNSLKFRRWAGKNTV